MALRRNVTRTAQPQHAVGVDWGNPITSALSYWRTGNVGPGEVVSGAKQIATSFGIVSGFGGLGSGTSDSILTTLSAHATQRTYFAIFQINGAGGGGIGRVFDKQTGATAAEFWSFQSINTRFQFTRAWSGGNAVWSGPTGGAVTGGVYSAAITYDSSSTANNPRLFIGGFEQTVTTTTAPTGTLVNNSDVYVLGNRTNDLLRNWDGWIGPFFVWDRILSPDEIQAVSKNPWQLFAPLSRKISVVSGTISRPGTDVSVAGWTFNGASLSASIGETTRDDAFYAEAAYGVSGAITALTLPLAAGSYIVTFAGEYLSAAAASGQFRFTALDGSNTSLGVSAWQSVTSAYAQYDVPITVTGGTATRLKIEIQA
jgi:hypothetical protein